MVEAASMFRKSGFNDSDAAMLAKVATMYQNVSDTAISAESAAASIVSQIRAFGEDANFAQTIIDAYNEVANNFAVGTNDLSNAMEIASAGLSTYNNSFQETLGLITAGAEIFVGRSSQVARGLSTIASNVAKSKDELAKYDISVIDLHGNMRSTYDILHDVSNIWGSLADAEKQALGESLSGGVNQYKVLSAILQNFQTAIDATTTALNSSGSAANENAKYMEHLEAQINNLRAQFQDFANNVLDNEVVSGFINVGNVLLEFANTDVGIAITRTALLSGTILGVLGVLGQLAASLSKMKTALSTTSVLGGIFTPKSILIITGVATALTMVVEAIKGVKSTQKEASLALETTNNELSQNEQQLESNKQKLDELNSTPYENRSSDIELETAKLEAENEVLSRQIELLKEKRKESAQKSYESKKEVYTGEKEYEVTFSSDRDSYNYLYTVKVVAENVEDAYAQIASRMMMTTDEVVDGIQDIEVEYRVVKEKGVNATKSLIDIMQEYSDASKDGIISDESKVAFEQNLSLIQQTHEQIQYLSNEYERAHPEIATFEQLYQDLFPSISNVNNEEEEAIKNTGDLTDAVDKLSDELYGAESVSGETATKVKSIAESIVGTTTAVDTTSKAFVDLVAEEIIFNKTGLSVADKIAALSQLAQASGMAATSIAAIQGAYPKTTITEDQIRGYMRTAQLKGRPITRQQAENMMLAELWKSKSSAPTRDVISSGYTGSGGSSYSQSIDTTLEALKDAVSYQQQLYQLSVASGQSTEQQARYLRQLQDALHNQAQYMRSQLSQGQADTTEIVGLSVEWWNAQNQINDLYKDTTSEIDKEKESLETIVNSLESELEILEKQRDNIKSQMNEVSDKKSEIEDIVSYMSEYSNSQIDLIQDEIDAIDEAADAINEKYDAQIEALEKTNNELDKEIKRQKLLAALTKAQSKQVLVYQNGQFVYTKDVEAIAKAQTELDAFNKEQLVEDEKAAIEQNRKNELAYNNQEKSTLEAEKKRWQEYKNGWDNLIKDYNNQQTELLLSQKYGVNVEAANWDDRLANFSRFVNDYENVMQEYIGIQKELSSIEEDIAQKQDEINSARDNLNNYDNSKQELPRVLKVNPNGNAPSNAKIGDYIVTGGGIYQITGGTSGNWTSNKVSSVGFSGLDEAKSWLSAQGYVFQYAKGTKRAVGGLSMVGEEGPELRVLNSGDGIIPSNMTNNLWQWGALSPSNFLDKIKGLALGNNNALGNSNTYQFNIDNLSLPNVNDARGLLNGLRRYAFQVAYGRG